MRGMIRKVRHLVLVQPEAEAKAVTTKG